MYYQALARKWRPKKFSDIVGQEHIIQAIKHSFTLNKFHHAYLLSGTRGVGKTTIARLFAKGLNCETNMTVNICGQCNICQDIENGCFVDFIEIDAASRAKVEDTREFLDNVQYIPSFGRFKIYLIDEAHMLSRHSFNALLKTLEEPPEHVKFILVTTEYQKLPKTILSRCLQFFLKPLTTCEIKKQLIHIFHHEKIIIDQSALETLARVSNGSMRDALNLAEQAIVLGNNNITSDVINNMFGILNIECIFIFIENLINNDFNQIMNYIDEYTALGINWDYLFIEILTIFQQISMNQFLLNISNNKNNKKKYLCTDQRIYKLSTLISPESVQLYYQIFLIGRKELPYAPSYRIGMEMTVLRALAFVPDKKNSNIQYTNIFFEKKNNFDDKISHEINNESNTNTIMCLPSPKFRVQSDISKNIKITQKLEDISNVHLNYSLFNNHDAIQMQSKKFYPSHMFNQYFTIKLLEERAKLLEYKKNSTIDTKKNKLDTILKHQQKISDILTRFSNIHTQNIIPEKFASSNEIGINNIEHANMNIFNVINYKNNRYKNMSNILKYVLMLSIKNNPWILQIYQLSLPEKINKFLMNTWKEEINKKEICLYLCSNYQFSNFEELKNKIQQAFSKYKGTTVFLNIKRDYNNSAQTPIEQIYKLYQKKILEIKKFFLNDPYIKIIQKKFDATFFKDNFDIYN